MSWFHNWLRDIPDKTLSVAVALAVLKHGFSLFERELVHGGPSRRQPCDTAAAPIILGCLYLSAFVARLLIDGYVGARYW